MNDIGLMLANKEEYYVDNFGIVPPITIKDFIRMGDNYEKFYENILLPWRLGWRSFYTESQYDDFISEHSDIDDFDIFFINFDSGKRASVPIDDENVELVFLLKKSIDFIFNCNCEIDFNYGVFKISDKQYITRLNYEKICSLVLKTNSCEKSKREDDPIFENDRQRDIYYKLQDGRKRINDKNKLGIKQVLNITMVYTKYQMNDKLKEMTIYQLFNTYSSLSLEDGYKLNLTYVPIVADIKKLDLEHWSTKLK